MLLHRLPQYVGDASSYLRTAWSQKLINYHADALIYSALPTILVSCKCDNPVNTRQIDTDSIEAACLTEVQTIKTASNVPESARLCLGAMLRTIMAHRKCKSNLCFSIFYVESTGEFDKTHAPVKSPKSASALRAIGGSDVAISDAHLRESLIYASTRALIPCSDRPRPTIFSEARCIICPCSTASGEHRYTTWQSAQ